VLAEVAEAEAGCRGDAPQDLLRLSTGCYTVYGWLPPVLARWQAEHPSVELRLVLEATRQPIPALLGGELDLALVTDAPRHERLREAPLVDDELCLLVPAAHPLSRRPYVTAEELAREHVLVYDAPRDQLDLFTRLFWPAGVEPKKVSRVPLTEALIELVRGGLGVTALASWVLPSRRHGLGVVRLTRKGLRRRWYAVSLRSRAPAPALTRFVALLCERLARQE
jgi:LysR family transcriptional regulator for metE and metH